MTDTYTNNNFIEKHHIYNNDLGTFFVLVLLYLPIQIFVECKWKRRIILILLLTLTWYDPEPFRWFQTEYIIKQITVEKIFTHDTRKTHTFINIFDEDKPFLEQYHTGTITTYITSTLKEIFILNDYLYPTFMNKVELQDTIIIKASRYTLSRYYCIYSFSK